MWKVKPPLWDLEYLVEDPEMVLSSLIVGSGDSVYAFGSGNGLIGLALAEFGGRVLIDQPGNDVNKVILRRHQLRNGLYDAFIEGLTETETDKGWKDYITSDRFSTIAANVGSIRIGNYSPQDRFSADNSEMFDYIYLGTAIADADVVGPDEKGKAADSLNEVLNHLVPLGKVYVSRGELIPVHYFDMEYDGLESHSLMRFQLIKGVSGADLLSPAIFSVSHSTDNYLD